MRIEELEIETNDLIETEKFYNKLLGFKIRERSDLTISFAIGTSILTFKKTEIKPVYHFAFNISNNLLNEALDWISSKATILPFENKPIIDFPNWDAQSVYFYDNNGNILEFIARFDLENKSDPPFETTTILSISEVGLVADSVELLAEKFIKENDLAYFSKQIQRKDFSAIGNDEGLLILVDSKRNWFPTNIKAENFPTKVVIENNGKKFTLLYE